MAKAHILRHRILTRAARLALTVLLFTSMLPQLLTSCSVVSSEPVPIADYGLYGSDLALKLARTWPSRAAGTPAERAVADFLFQSFSDLGYKPERMAVRGKDSAGGEILSQNIIVRISGTGQELITADNRTERIFRQVIVGAHYDNRPPAPSAGQPVSQPLANGLREPTDADYDGISANASGIGALFTLARELKKDEHQLDIILIAFGAGGASFAGAETYAAQMTPAEQARTEAMYCIDSIYAGDKMYVHSGRSSVLPDNRHNYALRRKMYEATDVFFEHKLLTNNGYGLYTNQSEIETNLPGIHAPVLYREWTFTDSDYIFFDALQIPIVFFESYDYNAKDLQNLRESRNPYFSLTNGRIRDTRYDSSAILAAAFATRAPTAQPSVTPTANQLARQDRLSVRINNTAFVIFECIRKGITESAVHQQE